MRHQKTELIRVSSSDLRIMKRTFPKRQHESYRTWFGRIVFSLEDLQEEVFRV